jgi:hypothetical protein
MSRFVAYICLALGCFSVAVRAQEAKPRSPNEVYKVEYIFSELQDGKKVNARSYVVLVRPMDKGSLRLGSRIPIATGASKEGNPLVNTSQFMYLDVGVNIDCSVEPLDSEVHLYTGVDISRVAPENRIGQPIVRTTKVQLHNIVPLGKPTLLTSADEVDTTGRFQIEATVTKIK